MNQKSILMACCMFALVAGCAAEGGDASDLETLGGESQALRIDGTELSAYYTARRDTRRCAWPLCGGTWVRAANQTRTVCADGSTARECYVTELDVTNLGLTTDEQYELRGAPDQVVFRGAFGTSQVNGRTVASFVASEAWRAVNASPASGTFFKAQDSGIRCITTPCPSTEAGILNSSLWFEVTDVDRSAIGATEAQQAAIGQAIAEDAALLAARYRIARGRGLRLELVATQAYLRVRTAVRACGSRGLPQCGEDEFCSFPTEASCGRFDAPGVCTRRPEACTTLYAPVCGCDGRTYGNACSAANQGVSVDYEGECADRCAVDDARATGRCLAFFGYAWTGTTCAGLSGCSCEGEDCGELTLDYDACIAAHEGCAEEPQEDIFCGGFAGIQCPGAGQCVDDPSDSCDPRRGGADCGGICECSGISIRCVEGFVFDTDPSVCGCVAREEQVNPCAYTLCPTGTLCEVHGSEAACVPQTGERCGNVTCGEGLVCCNASCGICTPPGFFCTQQACVDPQ